jgi:hypothetical protein
MYDHNDHDNKPLFPSFTDVLTPITCCVGGKHQWCWVLNTLQSAVSMGAAYCQKRAVLLKDTMLSV